MGIPMPFGSSPKMYWDGLGVPRDPIAACSLAEDAETAAQMTPPARPMQTMDDAVAIRHSRRRRTSSPPPSVGALWRGASRRRAVTRRLLRLRDA
jgi:hypothetical protein